MKGVLFFVINMLIYVHKEYICVFYTSENMMNLPGNTFGKNE